MEDWDNEYSAIEETGKVFGGRGRGFITKNARKQFQAKVGKKSQDNFTSNSNKFDHDEEENFYNFKTSNQDGKSFIYTLIKNISKFRLCNAQYSFQ